MKFLYRPLYNMLTAGETTESLRRTLGKLRNAKFLPIADYIQESATRDEDVERVVREYEALTTVKELDAIALKPSSFRHQFAPMDRLVARFVKHQTRVFVDAEDAANHVPIQRLTNSLVSTYNTDAIHVYKTYQMYRRDSLLTLQRDLEHFPRLGIKLVRGAYWNQDRKSGELFEAKKETDAAFRQALRLIMETKPRGLFHAMICTHNARDIDYMIQMNPRDGRIAHASLYGFLPNDTQKIQAAGIPTYKYLPYGAMDDAIPYLTRRIQENPWVLRYCLN